MEKIFENTHVRELCEVLNTEPGRRALVAMMQTGLIFRDAVGEPFYAAAAGVAADVSSHVARGTSLEPGLEAAVAYLSQRVSHIDSLLESVNQHESEDSREYFRAAIVLAGLVAKLYREEQAKKICADGFAEPDNSNITIIAVASREPKNNASDLLN